MASLLPAMTQEKLDNQRDVVKNERRWSVDNQPYGDLGREDAGAPLPGGPRLPPLRRSARWRTCPPPRSRTSSTFFATYYAPNNAVLTIAGDVEPATALALAEQYFGPIPANADLPPPPDMTLDPHLGSEVREVVPDQVPLARIYLAHRAPVFGQRRVPRHRGGRRPAGRRPRVAPVRAAGARQAAGPGRRRLPLPDRGRRVHLRAVGHCAPRRRPRGRSSGRWSRRSTGSPARARPRWSWSACATCTPQASRRAWSASASAPTGSACTPASSTSRSASTTRSRGYEAVTADAVRDILADVARPDNRLVLTYLPAEAPAATETETDA